MNRVYSILLISLAMSLPLTGNCQETAFDNYYTKIHLERMLSEIVFRYLLAGYSHYPDSIRPALAKKYFNSPAAALLEDTSISYKAIMPLDIQPIVTSPDYYLITILDWVIIHNKDTIPIPLPKEFNRNMRSYVLSKELSNAYQSPKRPSKDL